MKIKKINGRVLVKIEDTGPIYKLTPLAMRIPNRQGIYGLSKLQVPKMLTWYEFTANYTSSDILVSQEPDGISNPETMTAYGFGLDCWYLVEFVPESEAV